MIPINMKSTLMQPVLKTTILHGYLAGKIVSYYYFGVFLA